MQHQRELGAFYDDTHPNTAGFPFPCGTSEKFSLSKTWLVAGDDDESELGGENT